MGHQKISWSRKQQPTPVLPEKFQEQKSLVGFIESWTRPSMHAHMHTLEILGYYADVKKQAFHRKTFMAFVGLKKVLNYIHRMRLLGNKTTVLIYYTLSISLLSYVSSLFEYVERFEEFKLTYSKHLLRNGWAANKDTI